MTFPKCVRACLPALPVTHERLNPVGFCRTIAPMNQTGKSCPLPDGRHSAQPASGAPSSSGRSVRSAWYSRVPGLILLLALLALAGCGGNPTGPGAPVTVGVLYPLSGDLAEKGRDSLNGIRLAVEEINASGGIASLGYLPLRVVTADTRGLPEVGAREAERLILQEHAVALVGTYQSSVTRRAAQVAEQQETPFLVSISIADILTERGFRYTFRIQPKAGFYCRDQIRFLKELGRRTGAPVRRVALLHENTDFGTSAALVQRRMLREEGFEVVAAVSYAAAEARDLRPEVARVLAARPDVILEVTYLTDSILIRRALAEARAKVLLLDLAGGTVSPRYVKELGPLAEGTLTLTEFSTRTPVGVGLNRRFRSRFGEDITGDSAYAYQAVWVLKEALEKAGTTDRGALRQALASLDLPPGPRMILPASRLRFDRDGQNESAHLFVAQIQNGVLVPVWPEESALAPVWLPGRDDRE